MALHHGHTYGDVSHGGREGPTAISSIMVVIVAIIATLVLMALVFAWSPWRTTTTVPETEPRQEQQVPGQPQQLLPR
jgi:hypothetical protein